MSNVAREMLRMLGLGMGTGVNSDLRLQKIRELRAQDVAHHEDEEARKPNLRVITGSVPAKGSFTTRPRR